MEKEPEVSTSDNDFVLLTSSSTTPQPPKNDEYQHSLSDKDDNESSACKDISEYKQDYFEGKKGSGKNELQVSKGSEMLNNSEKTPQIMINKTINNYNAPVLTKKESNKKQSVVNTKTTTTTTTNNKQSVIDQERDSYGRIKNASEGTFLGNCVRCNKQIHRSYHPYTGEQGEQGYFTCSTYCGGVCIHVSCADDMARESLFGKEIILNCPNEEFCNKNCEGGPIIISPTQAFAKTFLNWLFGKSFRIVWKAILIALILGYVMKFFIFSQILSGLKQPDVCFNPHLKNASHIRVVDIFSYRFAHINMVDEWAYIVKYRYEHPNDFDSPNHCFLKQKLQENIKNNPKGHFGLSVFTAYFFNDFLSTGIKISFGLFPDYLHFQYGLQLIVMPFFPAYMLFFKFIPWIWGKCKLKGYKAKVRVGKPSSSILKQMANRSKK